MKKLFSILLATILMCGTLSISASATTSDIAYVRNQTITIDGVPVIFQTYALVDANGGETNYIKVRDVAYALNSTSAQFNVTWDGAVNLIPNTAYTANGSEMTTPFSGNRSYTIATAPTKINGVVTDLDAIYLTDDNGGGYTYYKLRDLGTALGFVVDWSAETGITVTTNTINTATIFYTEYPTVPDFGAMFGINVVETYNFSGDQLYMYNLTDVTNLGNNSLTDYQNCLFSNGFNYVGSFDGPYGDVMAYQKDNVYVMMGLMKGASVLRHTISISLK